MTDLNIGCTHETKELWTNFCYKCGAIWMKSVDLVNKVYSVKYKSFNYQPEIPPLENFHHIEKAIGYKTYFKKVKTNMSDFYKKARISCIKFIRKLVDDFKYSPRTFVLSVLFLDLIYLNYDYFTILKEFKSELMAVGCFLAAVKFDETKPEIPNYKRIKMSTFKEVSYEMNEVRKYEDYVLKFLSFKLNFYTTFNIIETLLSNGVIFNYECSGDESYSTTKEKVKKVNKLSFQLLLGFIEDSGYVNFNHIEIAFSCIVFAKELLRFKEIFPSELEKIYNIKMGNFIKCYQYLSSINKKLKHDFQERFTVIGKNQIKEKNEKTETKKKNEESDKKQPVKPSTTLSNKTRNTKESSNKKLHLRTESTNVNSTSSNKDELNTSSKYHFAKSKTIRNYSVSIVNKLSFAKKVENSNDTKDNLKRNLSAKNNKEHFDNIENDNIICTLEEVKAINGKANPIQNPNFNTGDLSNFKTKILKRMSENKLSYK